MKKIYTLEELKQLPDETSSWTRHFHPGESRPVLGKRWNALMDSLEDNPAINDGYGTIVYPSTGAKQDIPFTNKASGITHIFTGSDDVFLRLELDYFPNGWKGKFVNAFDAGSNADLRTYFSSAGGGGYEIRQGEISANQWNADVEAGGVIELEYVDSGGMKGFLHRELGNIGQIASIQNVGGLKVNATGGPNTTIGLSKQTRHQTISTDGGSDWGEVHHLEVADITLSFSTTDITEGWYADVVNVSGGNCTISFVGAWGSPNFTGVFHRNLGSIVDLADGSMIIPNNCHLSLSVVCDENDKSLKYLNIVGNLSVSAGSGNLRKVTTYTEDAAATTTSGAIYHLSGDTKLEVISDNFSIDGWHCEVWNLDSANPVHVRVMNHTMTREMQGFSGAPIETTLVADTPRDIAVPRGFGMKVWMEDDGAGSSVVNTTVI